MEERFSIYLTDDETRWLEGGDRTATGDPAAAVAAAGELAIVLLVPGEAVLLTAAPLPPVRREARRRQAVLYALEEQLAAPVESLHFALGRESGGDTPVALVARAEFDHWLEILREAGGEPAAVTPDYLCLPTPEPDCWHVYLVAGRALVRCGEYTGFTCETDLLPSLLASGREQVSNLRVLTDEHEAARAVLERLEQHDYQLEIERADPDTVYGRLLAFAAQRPQLNLRQGDYAPVSKLQAWWRPLQATAALFAAWLVLSLAVQGMTYWQLRNQAEDLRAQAEVDFRAAFPNVERIRDLRVQAEEQLRTLRGNGSASRLFLLLQSTASAAGGDAGLTIDALQYRDGSLYLSLSGQNVQALERLRSGFQQQPAAELVVESADAGSDGVQIRARVDKAGV